MLIDGTYEIAINSPIGNMTGILVLQEEDGAVTGTIESGLGKNDFSGGKVKDGCVTWDVKLSSPVGKILLSCSAVIEQDIISGDVEAGGFGTFPFAGKRI